MRRTPGSGLSSISMILGCCVLCICMFYFTLSKGWHSVYEWAYIYVCFVFWCFSFFFKKSRCVLTWWKFCPTFSADVFPETPVFLPRFYVVFLILCQTTYM